ncbi:MAG: ATP-binding protein [Candidatus Methanomethylophilaceae archaeon]|nr:ATP-binding protein [Candidatus Methanomethylophilaceae archaeon]
MEPPAQDGCESKVMDGRTMGMYYLSLAVTIVAIGLGILTGNAGDLVMTVPVAVALVYTMFIDRDLIHIPPALVLLMVCTSIVAMVVRVIEGGDVIEVAASVLTGINLELVGLIAVFILMGTSRDENPGLVMGMSMAVAIAVFATMTMVQFYVSKAWVGLAPMEADLFADDMLMVYIGAFITAILYRYDRKMGIFRMTLGSFLEGNSGKLGLEDRERRDILDTIAKGESENLEFKSTLRTNLQTGETDKRMEKAVLKTIVAFLNSDGGTLMVGVSDDGAVCGIDLYSFDNRDKLNLHFTNMISSAIGNEFLPYISFRLVDFEEGSVLRVDCGRCRKPVFLREGKGELFYVRSGPSSVELTGANMINYVGHRNQKKRKEFVKGFEE